MTNRFALAPLLGAIVLLLSAALPLFAATRTVTNTNDSGPGSLRQALLEAESGDRIEFAIGSGPQTIQPLTDLPQNGKYVIVDGTTQPGYSGQPLIELTGNYPFTNIGLHLNGEVIGLAITGFEGAALIIGNGTVRGCHLGADRTGTMARPNGNGIFVREVIGVGAPPLAVTVGGANPGDGNLISGDAVRGIAIEHYMSLSVQGNLFGSNLAQTAPLGSMQTHIVGTPKVARIGDEAPNVFVGASGAAIGSGHAAIVGNLFGVTSTGALIPNAIAVDIGARSEVRGNTFRGHTIAAVRIGGDFGTQILANSMDGDGFGIDLGMPGVNPNDDSDTDGGPNNLLNHPILDRAKIIGETVVLTGSISVPANRQHRIELYANSVCNASGYGEGRDLIEAFVVMTDAAGRASFERVLPLMPVGTVITATVTSDFEGTSEFSRCAFVEGPGVFAFDSTFSSVSESGSASVIVRRRLGAAGPASVSYAVTGGTATPGTDFTGGSGTLAFADGETSKTIVIPIVDDNIHEDGETIQLQLSNPTGGTTIGSPETTTVIIANDDPPPSLRIGTTEVTEGNSGLTPVGVRFSLSHPSSAPQTFPYTTMENSAKSDDFVPVTGTLTFQPGETEKVVTFQVVGDPYYEPREHFHVFSSPTSFGGVYILNDDPVPTLSVKNLPVTEGNAGESTVYVTLTATQPITGEVYVTLHAQSARFPDDYRGGNDWVFFDNEMTKTFPITIVGDTIPEPHETLGVHVWKWWGNFDVAPELGVVTILNDDMSVTPAERMIAAGQTGDFVVDLGSPTAADMTLTLASSAPDAVAVPATVVVPAGASGAAFEARALVPNRTATIQVTVPGYGSRSVQVTTYAKVTLRFTPSRLELVDGETATVSVSVEPAQSAPLTVGLTSIGPVTVPSGVTIPAGGSATFEVTATGTGAFTVDAHLPPVHGNEIQSLHGNARSSEAAAPPRIELVQPSTGTTQGGTHVRVTGSGFDSHCWLFFGGSAADDVVVRDANTITATTPFYPAVAVDLTVRCSGGEFTAPAAFQYRTGNDPAPLLSSVEPEAAVPGQLVTIRGLNFRPEHLVTFDATQAEIVDAFPDALVVRVPGLAPGRVSITVTDRLGRSTTSGPVFEVLEARPVRVDSIEPAVVPAGGELTLTGDGFHPGLAFEIGGRPAEVVTLELTRVVLRTAGNTPAGTHTLFGRGVTVTSLGMVATSVNRRCASATGGTLVEIRGRGFTSAATVTFDGVPATDVTMLNSTVLRVRVPAGEIGPARIAVSDGSRTATLTNAFAYVSPFAPSGTCAGRVRAARR